jgi:hypothetical protein
VRSRLAALLVAALAVSGLSLLATPSASAAVPAPTNLTADFGSDPNHIPRNPTLRWTPASGATGYRVQIATDSSFSSTVYDQQTVGHQVTPNMSLPIGTLYWRVAGLAGTTSGPFASAQSFTESWNTKPQLTAPANTSALTYPDNPAVFRRRHVVHAADR